MYDIKPLEEEWEKYNKKRKRPRYIFILIALLALGAGLAWKYSDYSLSNTDKNSSAKKIQASNVLVDKAISTLEVHKVKVNDNNIAANGIKTVLTDRAPDNNPMDPGDVFVERDEKMVKTVKNTSKPVAEEQPRIRKKIHFEITDARNPTVYKEIERRFSVAPNTDDALFLARMYYRKGDYRKSAYWALQTNKLNGNIEESWLIFARSKAKTGLKNEAIRVLSQYVKKSNSVEAKMLLKKLER